MLKSWFCQQANAYWLATDELHQQAIKQNQQIGFNDALPLFHGESFKEVMPLSPWLIPIQDSFNNVEPSTFSQGMVIVSNAPIWDVVVHLRSLLFVAMDGEEVLFRYYDKNVLAAVLATFTQSEINAWLGNAQQLALMQDDELKIYRNTSQLEYQLQNQPWWKMEPHHLAPTYQVAHHAKVIERRLWEKLPDQMCQLASPLIFIQQALQQALDHDNDFEQAESFALVKFSQQTQTDYSSLAQALLLTREDVQQLQQLEKETALWEC